MHCACAVQVAGTTRKISNLLQLVCQTDPPARIRDFDTDQLAAVFEARSWGRVVTALSVLARLKLLTPARRRRSEQGTSADKAQQGQEQQQQEDPCKAWVQAHARLVSTVVCAAHTAGSILWLQHVSHGGSNGGVTPLPLAPSLPVPLTTQQPRPCSRTKLPGFCAKVSMAAGSSVFLLCVHVYVALVDAVRASSRMKDVSPAVTHLRREMSANATVRSRQGSTPYDAALPS